MVWIFALALYFQEDATAAAPSAANGSALLEMIHNSGPVAFTVLVILLIASVFSWAIMLSKWSRFGKARTQSLRFIRAFRKSDTPQRNRGRRRAVQAQPSGRRLQRDP